MALHQASLRSQAKTFYKPCRERMLSCDKNRTHCFLGLAAFVNYSEKCLFTSALNLA